MSLFPDLQPVLPEYLLYTLTNSEATVWIVATSEAEAVKLSGLKEPTTVEWVHPDEVVEITLPKSDCDNVPKATHTVVPVWEFYPDYLADDEDVGEDEFYRRAVVFALASDWCAWKKGLIAVEKEEE